MDEVKIILILEKSNPFGLLFSFTEKLSGDIIEQGEMRFPFVILNKPFEKKKLLDKIGLS